MITNIIAAIIDLPNSLFRVSFFFVMNIVGTILDLLLTTLGSFPIPSFALYSQYITNFWDLCFQFMGYIRSIFLIDSISMNIIFAILVLKLVYKPGLTLIKMFVQWYSALKK